MTNNNKNAEIFYRQNRCYTRRVRPQNIYNNVFLRAYLPTHICTNVYVHCAHPSLTYSSYTYVGKMGQFPVFFCLSFFFLIKIYDFNAPSEFSGATVNTTLLNSNNRSHSFGHIAQMSYCVELSIAEAVGGRINGFLVMFNAAILIINNNVYTDNEKRKEIVTVESRNTTIMKMFRKFDRTILFYFLKMFFKNLFLFFLYIRMGVGMFI